MDQPDPQHGTGSQQLTGHERAAVVDVDGFRHPARGDPRPQRSGRVQHVLPRRPPVAAEQAAVVVKEAEQEHAAAVDQRAVQRVPGPQLVRALGLEAPQRTPDLPALPRQPSRHEMTLDRSRARRAPLRLQDDPVNLRRRPGGLLAAKRARQLQQALRRLVRQPPRRGDQRLEPATAIRPDPAIQRRARHADPPPIGREMLPRGQRADQQAALPWRERFLSRLARQLVAEQPNLLRPVLQPIHLLAVP